MNLPEVMNKEIPLEVDPSERFPAPFEPNHISIERLWNNITQYADCGRQPVDIFTILKELQTGNQLTDAITNGRNWSYGPESQRVIFETLIKRNNAGELWSAVRAGKALSEKFAKYCKNMITPDGI